MIKPEDEKPGQDIEPTPSPRSQEDLLRRIRLALAIDGLGLDERRKRARGFNPYDSSVGGGTADVWKGRRRG